MTAQANKLDHDTQPSCCISTTAVEHNVCFHCLDPLPKYGSVYAEIAGQKRALCCYGCEAAAKFIDQDDLSEFYQRRSLSIRAEAGVDKPVYDSARSDWSFLDSAELNSEYVSTSDSGSRELTMVLQGLYCSSCAWLIENALKRFGDGILSAVDIHTNRLDIILADADVHLSEVIATVEKLGYRPVLCSLHGEVDDDNRRLEQRLASKRIVVAGFGMMQVMTYMLAVYLGEFQGIEASFHRFLTLVSLLVATAVVFYSGKPFFDNALNDISHLRLGMDVPIALAIAGAYFPSVYLTLTNIPGHIYFDSAVMFIFFLSVGRYIETRARHRLAGSAHSLADLFAPLIRVERDGKEIHIKPTSVQVGDQLHLHLQQRLPFDGVVIAGESLVDESFITGESMPVLRQTGDQVVAGSIALADTLVVEANADWRDSSIAQISGLMKRATMESESQTTLFDHFARYFVVFVLLLTMVVGFVWWQIDPGRAFEICLAMLVASCPCAFALAGPAGVASASHALRQQGLLITNFKALSILSRVTTWVFDKTGTLTRGRPEITAIRSNADLSDDDVLQIAASLEQDNQHVLSCAFTSSRPLLEVANACRVAGQGVLGDLDGQRLYLGKLEWVLDNTKSTVLHAPQDDLVEDYPHESIVALGGDQGLFAIFSIQDQLRPEAPVALNNLKEGGYKLAVMSGDRQAAVAYTCRDLPLDLAAADLQPEDKVSELDKLHANSEVVAMVGDGINDAPIISQADVSIAMSTGSAVSQSTADIIVLNGRLSSLPKLVDIAVKTSHVTRQNLVWALVYNGLILPFAAFGLITPWLAALGMSLSSVLVVLNALRIGRIKKSQYLSSLQTRPVT